MKRNCKTKKFTK